MFGKAQNLTGSANNSIDRREHIEDFQSILEDLVGYAADKGGSDIHLRIGSYPVVRINGDLTPIKDFSVLSVADIEGILQCTLNQRDRKTLEENRQVDTSMGFASIGRVPINAFYQRGSVALAIRMIKTKIPTLDELGVPEVLYKILRLRNGLVLTTGATGSGKSTTLAAIIDDINQRYPKHIITIEDPVEFLFRDKQSIIAQREIGIDARSFKDGMAAALREDPDVILLSDLRDMESMEFAMDAAETGHLVLGTLHSPTAPDAISRIVGSFPAAAQNTIRNKLSQNLKAVIGQRLLPNKEKNGRVLACEVMLVSSRIQELILDPMKVADIADLMRKSKSVDGVMSFDYHIFELYQKKLITEEVALRYSTSPNDMGLRIKGFSA